MAVELVLAVIVGPLLAVLAMIPSWFDMLQKIKELKKKKLELPSHHETASRTISRIAYLAFAVSFCMSLWILISNFNAAHSPPTKGEMLNIAVPLLGVFLNIVLVVIATVQDRITGFLFDIAKSTMDLADLGSRHADATFGLQEREQKLWQVLQTAGVISVTKESEEGEPQAIGSPTKADATPEKTKKAPKS
jgi:hypothetical protein